MTRYSLDNHVGWMGEESPDGGWKHTLGDIRNSRGTLTSASTPSSTSNVVAHTRAHKHSAQFCALGFSAVTLSPVAAVCPRYHSLPTSSFELVARRSLNYALADLPLPAPTETAQAFTIAYHPRLERAQFSTFLLSPPSTPLEPPFRELPFSVARAFAQLQISSGPSHAGSPKTSINKNLTHRPSSLLVLNFIFLFFFFYFLFIEFFVCLLVSLFCSELLRWECF